jgi:hypothetical protein
MLRLRVGVPVVAALLLAGGWLMGEDPKKPEDNPPPIKVALPTHWKKLGLSDQQHRDVLRVKGTYAAKIAELEQKVKDLKAEEKTELLMLLTETQKTRLKEILVGETPKPVDKDPKDPKSKDGDKPPDKPTTKEKTTDK